jgi:hypothetical protein
VNKALLFASGVVLLSGCLSFDPVEDSVRVFVLSPAAAAGGPAAAKEAPAVGIFPVEIPAHLRKEALAVRKGANELQYVEASRWGERLDKGLQRVIGHNLSLLLGSDCVHLSVWRREEVRCELQVVVDRLEMMDTGEVALEAVWRVTAPGGEKGLAARRARVARTGPSPLKDPAGAVAALSDAVGELSREIARSIPRE